MSLAIRRPDRSPTRRDAHDGVGGGERAATLVAGSVLIALAARRQGKTGWLLAGAGGAMILRGATASTPLRALARGHDDAGLQLRQSFAILRSPAELYREWRDLERLPRILTHLEKVTVLDERRSRWTVQAPRLAGGHVEWEAEIVVDEPGRALVWRSLPGSDVENVGEIRFGEMPGERGAELSVAISYRPPGGKLGDWIATLSGVGAKHQLREDLRAFKQRMETGEVPTIEGQPAGRCGGLGRLLQEGRTS